MRTKNLISLLLFALLKCHIGYAINCNSCVGECKVSEIKTCSPEEVCMIREMYIDGARQGQQKGCLHAQLCNTTSELEGMKQWCCNTDLCNTEIPPPGGATPTSTKDLLCHSCDHYMCIFKEAKMCAEKQVCVTKSVKIAGVPWKKYGCANSSICSTITTEEVASSQVSVWNDCCTSNLCNSAATLRLPLLAAVGALLFLWIVKLS